MKTFTETCFIYSDDALAYLTKADPALGRVIATQGRLQRPVTPDLFYALCESIVSQQISVAAAKTVFARFLACVGEVTPVGVHAVPTELIQQCGMSMRKASYLSHAATSALLGTPSYGYTPPNPDSLPVVNFDILHTLSDAELITTLSTLKGVGKWTAQMLLIFSLNRLDVTSFDDLALRRGLKNLHNLSDMPTRAEFDALTAPHSPYRSVASLYLWAIS